MKQKVCVAFFGFLLVFSVFVFCGMAKQEQEVYVNFFYEGQMFKWQQPNSQVFVYQEELQKHGRMGDHKQRAELVNKIVNMGFSIEEAFCYVFPGIDKTLQQVCDVVNRPKKDATLNFDPKNFPYFSFTNEQIGLFVDKAALLKQVQNQLKISNNIKLTITPNKIMPTKTVKQLQEQTYLRASFSTDFSKSSQNRKDNIALALKNFDGMTILPGQTYSFNSTTGKRTEQKGYKEANIILNNEYVESFGGGVCQASTTLFNALLLAGAEIVESHPHSLESGYIEKGFDAMVNFGSSDLKWKNNTEAPMYVHAFTTDSKVCVQIFGERNPFYIKRVCEVLEEKSLDEIVVEDSTLEIGKSVYKTLPKTGSTSKSFLEFYKNGKLVKRKLLRKQTYKPVQGVKIVGTHERPLKNFQNFSQNTAGSQDFTTWKPLGY